MSGINFASVEMFDKIVKTLADNDVSAIMGNFEIPAFIRKNIKTVTLSVELEDGTTYASEVEVK